MATRSAARMSALAGLIGFVVAATAACEGWNAGGGGPGARALAAWSPAPGLKTRWAGDVDPADPLPEYPRPQMARTEWHTLNGLWELAIQPDSDTPPAVFPDTILVPFPVESSLSGVAQRVTPADRVWYRRSFSLPDAPAGTRWLLHFGGVDWEAQVFLNGRSLGVHRGGYDPFSLELTEALVPGQEQELVVAVRDPTDDGDQPRGKQVLDPHGIWYTAVTGIWQTVWLEPVPSTYLRSLRITPDLQGGSVTVAVEVEGAESPVGYRATASAAGAEVARGEGRTGESLTLAIPHPHAWSPADPFLYDLRVELESGDAVGSYFGMRSIAVGPDAEGRPRLLLNGEPLFQFGLLDQGWWPDGLYTAPTDEALRSDIVTTKALGFNLIRKHVKVEPARWYYHADREGVLVWQDMPSADNETPEGKEEFARELDGVVSSLVNHPSIVMWVPFNEGWGQHDTERYVAWLKGFDATRLVNNASGWTDAGVGDVLDTHSYPGPAAPDPGAAAGRVPVLGEFGGLGLPLPGHTWVEEENWGYRSFATLEELNQAYGELLFQLRPLIGEGLAAAVYTQTTDVEVEVNGVMTYDREGVKLSQEAVALNQSLFGPPPELLEIVRTSRLQAQNWRYTTELPAPGWFASDFDDGGWEEGPGGFGTPRTPGARVGTRWDTSELWIRRSFSLSDETLAALPLGSLYLRVHHDEDAEIFLNGIQVATLEGYTTGYRLFPMSQEVTALLRAGKNTLAAHVRQTDGGQFIDVGIVEWVERGGG